MVKPHNSHPHRPKWRDMENNGGSMLDSLFLLFCRIENGKGEGKVRTYLNRDNLDSDLHINFKLGGPYVGHECDVLSACIV